MMAGIHTHSFHGNMVLSWHFQLATLATGRGRGVSRPSKQEWAGPCHCLTGLGVRRTPPLLYLSGLRWTMPITNTFLPGLMPPLICPQNGTICKGWEKKQEVYSLEGKSQTLRSWGPDPLENTIRKEEGAGRDTDKISYQSWEVQVVLNWRAQGVV